MLLGQILKRVWFYISNSCLVLYTIKVDNHNYKIINHILICNNCRMFVGIYSCVLFLILLSNKSSEHH